MMDLLALMILISLTCLLTINWLAVRVLFRDRGSSGVFLELSLAVAAPLILVLLCGGVFWLMNK